MSNNNLKLDICEKCCKPHGNYPPLIFDKIQQLKRHFLKEDLLINKMHDGLQQKSE